MEDENFQKDFSPNHTSDPNQRKNSDEGVDFQDLANHLPQAIFEVDLQGRFTYVNRHSLEMFGYASFNKDEGLTVFDTMIPEEHDRIRRNMERSLKEKSSGNEYQAIRRDGSIFPVIIFSIPIIRENMPIGFRGIVCDLTLQKLDEAAWKQATKMLKNRVAERSRDLLRVNKKLKAEINERKKIETTLKQSERFYRGLFENAHDSIIIIDPVDEKVLDVNERCCELYRMKRSELVNHSLISISKKPDKGREHVAATLKGEGVYRFETVQYRGDGTEMLMEINASVVDYKGRKAILSINRDITEQRMVEREKEMIQAQLHQAQKMEAVGLLAGGIAHDFNNFSTVIMGQADIVSQSIDEDSPMQNNLKEIYAAVERVTAMTNRLLLFSKEKSSKPRPLSLNSIITNLLKFLKRLIGADIRIDLDLDPLLGRIMADPTNMDQVLMNLAVNAREAMPSGGVLKLCTRNVELFGQQRIKSPSGNYVRLTVSDTGCGMSQETQGRIFEPFFTTNKTGRGTGLGLSVVYGIVREHQGLIHVISEINRGAEFQLHFPVTDQKADKMEGAPQRTLDKVKGGRILYVEDETPVRRLFTQILRKEGFYVKAAKDSEEAIEIFNKEHGEFDLLLSDMVLPGKNGVFLVDTLKEIKPNLKVLLCSGYANRRRLWPIIQNANTPFLAKPFNKTELVHKVNLVLNQTTEQDKNLNASH